MAVKANTTLTTDITILAREMDFVSRFGESWADLREALSVSALVKKPAGANIQAYHASVTLAQSPNEGDEIPYSKATVAPVTSATLTLKKYAKAVTIEAVEKFGAEVAIEKTDNAFMNELRGEVLTDFYATLANGSLTDTATTFQAGVAKAIGMAKDAFKKMHLDSDGVVVFVNTLDAYDYLGVAQLTVQSAFGLDYVENFMGASKMILSSELARTKVIATPSANLTMYYVDASDSDFKKLGLDYTTDPVSGLIGFHAEGKYGTAVGEAFAIMGMKLWAEYMNGIAVITI